MVCSTAILSASLALSLLRHSAPPSQSFVLSPFSLNTVLAIVHDGAGGVTQSELTNILLNGCSPSDVTEHYSYLTRSLPSSNDTGVTIKSANRFYVNDTMKLRYDYKTHIQRRYQAQILRTNLRNKAEAAQNMSQFIEEATNGMFRDAIKEGDISNDAIGILINAVYFLGKWKDPFDPSGTHSKTFHGAAGDREMDFMYRRADFLVNQNSDFGTVLVLPYMDKKFKFFYVLPNENSNLETIRDDLDGNTLLSAIDAATELDARITVPKMKLESQLDGVEVLSKLGVSALFHNGADLSKIARTPLKVSKIKHNALIEMDEEGTEASAYTFLDVTLLSASIPEIKEIVIDRPFLFGVLRNDDIMFIGQFA